MKKDVRSSSDSGFFGKNLIYVLIALLIIYLVFFSFYVVSKFKEFDDVSTDFSERERLITANILSCATDINCNTIFEKKRYSCTQGLIPRCIDSFCKCA